MKMINWFKLFNGQPQEKISEGSVNVEENLEEIKDFRTVEFVSPTNETYIIFPDAYLKREGKLYRLDKKEEQDLLEEISGSYLTQEDKKLLQQFVSKLLTVDEIIDFKK